MNKKFLYLTKVSLRKKFKTKWFVITNIILAVAIILLLNINSIVTFFGGDFDSKTNIIVVDNNTNSYELFKIKNLGKVTTGSTPSSKKENMFGGDIPFITPADLESGQDKYGRYVTQEGAKNSRIVRAGSTLVCCIGATIGKVDKAIVDSCFNQQINAIEWDESINDIFGLYLFRQIAPLIRNKASHTTLPILNKGNFENIIIPKPPKPKQDLFAEKAQEIEAYIKTQQAELENAKTMFQSLLHHAFTGELTRRAYGE